MYIYIYTVYCIYIYTVYTYILYLYIYISQNDEVGRIGILASCETPDQRQQVPFLWLLHFCLVSWHTQREFRALRPAFEAFNQLSQLEPPRSSETCLQVQLDDCYMCHVHFNSGCIVTKIFLGVGNFKLATYQV